MRNSKADPHVDELPLELPDSMSRYEKESREAEAKLAARRRKTKKKRANHVRTSREMRRPEQ